MKRYIKADIVDIGEEPRAIRIAAAKNPSTRRSTLIKLAQDPDRLIRYLVYTNPNTPEDVLDVLDDSDFEYTEYCLAVDFYIDNMENFSNADLADLKLHLKDIVEANGYTYTGCSFYDRAQEFPEYYEDHENSLGDIALDLEFSGLEDDDFTDDLRDAVLDYICGRPGFTYQSSDWV